MTQYDVHNNWGEKKEFIISLKCQITNEDLSSLSHEIPSDRLCNHPK